MRSTLVVVLASFAAFAEPLKVGAAVPEFTLPDVDGKPVKLSDFKGKTVVLEWFNPSCPYVKASHTKGSLVGEAKKVTAKGVVWLAVDSGAAGKEGAGAEKMKAGGATFGLAHPLLVDGDGTLGKQLGATNTPHMMVIDKTGKLAYRGAIDNSPDGEGQSPEGGKLVNYVDAALDDLAAGRAVKTAETKAYGCSVKYAN